MYFMPHNYALPVGTEQCFHILIHGVLVLDETVGSFSLDAFILASEKTEA